MTFGVPVSDFLMLKLNTGVSKPDGAVTNVCLLIAMLLGNVESISQQYNYENAAASHKHRG